MKHLFSIVIPTLNGEETIDKLISQLVSHTSDYNTEIIVIDSGSKDKTVGIINKYKKVHKNLKLVEIENRFFSHSGTRNMGTKLASGKYIFFLSQDVALRNKLIFEYILEDFKAYQDAVAVFPKFSPYKNTPIVAKLEVFCRFDELDSFANEKGILIQNKKTPFTPLTKDSRMVWYSLFNSFAAYKRSFLLKSPFPDVPYAEDLHLGKNIIEGGFTKIYDNRAIVIHSHNYNSFEYYKREKEDFTTRTKSLGIKTKIKLGCKIMKIFRLKVSTTLKFYYLLTLLFYYLLKFSIFLTIRLGL